MSRHIVWDWNGTLLDDLHVVIEAVNYSLAAFGLGPLDEDAYRSHYRRPVRGFYDSLFGRPVSDDEWEQLNEAFHSEYFARVGGAPLTIDALDALSAVEVRGWGQSLLSMSPQEWLETVVGTHGLADRFALVDGLTGPTGGSKVVHLKEHVAALQLDPGEVVVVGDTPDDAVAAEHVGTLVVLYDGGSHHLSTLQAVGAPVAHSLLDAVEIASTL